MYTISDKRPNKGKLVGIADWATSRNIPLNLVVDWLTKYDFPVIKFGALKLAYEPDLDKCIQYHIEFQESTSLSRRADLRDKAAMKRLAVQEYLDRLKGGGGG